MVDIVVVYLSVEESFDTGFEAEFGIVNCVGELLVIIKESTSMAEGLPLPRGLMNFVRPTPKT